MIVAIIIFMIPLLAILVKSDIGLAIAEAIRHNSGAAHGAPTRELEELRTEVEHLRTVVDEMHGQLLENAERLDFAERMLSSKAGSTGHGEAS